MKTFLFILLACGLFSVSVSFAQTPQDDVQKAMKEGGKSATGALQDVLNNYLQIAAKNVTSVNSGVQLKLNWFALNGMDSAQKYSNVNFKHTAWQRNGEFLSFVGVDKSNKFTSLQGGFNYNFLNRRDTTMAFYTQAYLRPYQEEGLIIAAAVARSAPDVAAQLEPKLTAWLKVLYQSPAPIDFKTQLDAAMPGMFQHLPSDAAMAKYLEDQLLKDQAVHQPMGTEMQQRIKNFVAYEAVEILSGPLNTYIRTLGKTALAYPAYVTPAQATALVQFIDQQVAQNTFLNGTLKATSLTTLNKKVLADYQALVRYVGRQPLLTFSYLFTYGKSTILSSHVTGFTFLYGTGSWDTQKIGQVKLSLTDTLNSDDPTGKMRNFKRNIIAFQAGYNQVLAMQKKVSVMEVNGALELDRATGGYISKTDKTKFYFDANFRARLPSSPWLKFDLKWDPKDNNVFGFLDFTYNLDKP